jgi:Ras-related protein Rab-1A
MSKVSRKPEHDHLFKLVLIGDSGVGKSSLLMRFSDDLYSENYISTIGVDFRFRTVNVNNKVIKLQIWDTAGQERFRSITSAYYRGADAVLICYDVTNAESFDHVEEWISELFNVGNSDIIKLIIGNKADQENNKVIATEMGIQLAEKNNCEFIETSAKTSTNVDTAFMIVTTKLIEVRAKVTNIVKSISIKPKIKEHVSCCQ